MQTVLVVCFRVLVALLTRTFFQPDEYFQSLEPAYAAVFGYGYLTWEWLTDHPVRSVIYPALNIPVYWLLKVTGLHNDWPSLLACFYTMSSIALINDTWLDRRPENLTWCARCPHGLVGL